MEENQNRFMYIGRDFVGKAWVHTFYDVKTKVMYMSYNGQIPIVLLDRDGKPCIYHDEKER